MFIFKRRVYTCKKITFGLIERYCSLFEALSPALDKEGDVYRLRFKYNDKPIIFKRIVREIARLVCEPIPRTPFTLGGSIKLLEAIALDTNYVKIKLKLNSLIEGSTEKSINGEVVRRDDYIKSEMNSAFKTILEFTDWTEETFLSQVGFLEYEEIIGVFNKRRIKQSIGFIQDLTVCIASAFQKGVYKDAMRTREKALKEIEKETFDRDAYEERLLGIDPTRELDLPEIITEGENGE